MADDWWQDLEGDTWTQHSGHGHGLTMLDWKTDVKAKGIDDTCMGWMQKMADCHVYVQEVRFVGGLVPTFRNKL